MDLVWCILLMMEIIGFGTAVWKLEVTHMEHNISWRTIMASSPAQSAKLVYRSLPSSVVVQRDSPCRLQSCRPRAVATCFICNGSYGSALLLGGTKSGLPALCHVCLLMLSTKILCCHLPADNTASGSGKHHEKPSSFIPAFNKCGKWHLSNLFS
jgi:hypothetical protein